MAKKTTSPASTSHASEEDARAMALIKSSGVLNPAATLDTIMEVTRQLATVSPAPKAKHTDTFIHRHFIYKHEE